MKSNGHQTGLHGDAMVLHWPGRVLAAEDLRVHLNGHHELVLAARAIITPLAEEHLRAKGVRITREAVQTKRAAPIAGGHAWAYTQERAHPAVTSAIQAVQRDGLLLRELQADGAGQGTTWIRAIGTHVANGQCLGSVVFCEDAGLVCCVANKVRGVRAVALLSAAQAARAIRILGANLAAVEMPGRTFFELRQILRTFCKPEAVRCPAAIASTLNELDGHAHR